MNSYSEKKDGTLVELTLLGDNAAYSELVIRYERAVRGTAFKVTGNSHLAEDAAQDAFVAAWMHLDSLREREKFRSWICTVAVNCAKKLLVHYKNTTPDISFTDFENADLDENGENEILSLLVVDEEGAELHHAVEALSEKIRETVQLYYFEGFSVEEIADKLSLPAGTVKWRLSEGRKQLRKGYGMMEKEQNQKETLLARVMRQIEELKLWRLKYNKTGFKEVHQKVLKSIETLEDSKEKSYAMADVLDMMPGKRNDELVAQIKKAAEEGHNDDVMQSVMCYEVNKYERGSNDRLAYMKNTQIPYLEERGFKKALAYVWFWYGFDCFCHKHMQKEGLAAYEKVLELLTPEDAYYANALSAIHAEKLRAACTPEEKRHMGIAAAGEVLRRIGNKLYIWERPGYCRAMNFSGMVTWGASLCDHLLCDPDMKEGEQRSSSDGWMTMSIKEKDATVETLQGIFTHCMGVELKGSRFGAEYIYTWFCPGVGIVKQTIIKNGEQKIFELSRYTVCGGEGLLPLATGNEWIYCRIKAPEGAPEGASAGKEIIAESVYKVIFSSDSEAVLSSYAVEKTVGYTENFIGYMAKAKDHYKSFEDNKPHHYDVSADIKKAAELAETKRQKLYTAIAGEVLDRIYKTDPDSYPAYTEMGRSECFQTEHVITDAEKIMLRTDPRRDIEHLIHDYDMGEGHKAIYNDIYNFLAEPMGCVWSEEWVPGYHFENKLLFYWNHGVELTFDVLKDETVTVKAGTFENCRHLCLEIKGMKQWVFRGGKMEFWFAPGVGIVKFNRPINYISCTVDNVWELTAYSGTGKGFFPLEDGMVRKYEQPTLVNGWHGWVEYTYDQDESGFVIFRNASCTQDRANYEEYLKAKNDPDSAG